ncbi:MAG: ATPase, T2SS/T4P/T4SS family, partial [Cyanobacteria bacterium MAG IRC1_bin_28]|nr:ATPase, T2SS/T4P/T4SS family [Cyanobacteria bacterium MAG IRC1_bin_28]
MTPTAPGPLPEAGWQLVHQGFCSDQQLGTAFQRCRSGGDSLTRVLEDLAGHSLASHPLARNLQELQRLEQQLLYGCCLANVQQAVNQADDLLRLCQRLLPLEQCNRLLCLPVQWQDSHRRVTVLLAAGRDDKRRQEVEALVRQQGAVAVFQLALAAELREVLARLQLQEPTMEIHPLPSGEPGDPTERNNHAEASDLAATVAAEDTSPAVALADKILTQALSQGASDIHVEPQDNELVVRLRQDGVLQKTYSGLPRQMIPAVTSRFKIMAELDIA